MKWHDELQAVYDLEVAKDRFSVPNIYKQTFAAIGLDHETAERYTHIKKVLGESVAKHVLQAIIRATFLIELVKHPKIDSTKFDVRWASRLGSHDPRFASYQECLQIFDEVVVSLEQAIQIPDNCELLKLFATQKTAVPYEIPLDYRERTLDRPMHCKGNLFWFFEPLSLKVVKLRTYLRDPKQNSFSHLFVKAYSKIHVKTYLTDRVLTGLHKTNREKRWETHPGSVHFALRRTCLGIEYKLFNEICYFRGFPSDLKHKLEMLELLTRLEYDTARCPITFNELSFNEFETEMNNPTHGKSSFQVGHINPLKAINDDPSSGHTAENISWVSSEGNRIQGDLSVVETRALIRQIYHNYELFEVK